MTRIASLFRTLNVKRYPYFIAVKSVCPKCHESKSSVEEYIYMYIYIYIYIYIFIFQDSSKIHLKDRVRR